MPRGRKDKPISLDKLPFSTGAKMRKARQAKGITLTELAEQIGFAKSYLSGIENGVREPSNRVIEAYESVLGEEFEHEHVEMLLRSVEEWNLWRGAHPEIVPSLTRADLSNSNICGAYLSGANLYKANLIGTNLAGSDLSLANLRGGDLTNADLQDCDFFASDLSGSNLSNANFYRANLHEADLREAVIEKADFRSTQLIGANFDGASLHNTNLENAVVSHTIFANNDLRSTIGLELVNHLSHSIIDINTLYHSQGEIPDIFLRGCGLPDEMIGFVHSIAGAVQYYSVFISYNHSDEAFATRLYKDLQANNIRCWKYTEDMKIGDMIFSHIDKAIRLHDKLLVIFSENSIQSDWVAAEVEEVFTRENRENKQIFFPVTIDDAIKNIHTGWAAQVRRSRNIADFSSWKNQEQYQIMFERLLRDLKARGE